MAMLGREGGSHETHHAAPRLAARWYRSSSSCGSPVMGKQQRIAIIVCVVGLIGLLLFPPWTSGIGFSFFLYRNPEGQYDQPRLVFLTGAVIAVASLGFTLSGWGEVRSEPKRRRRVIRAAGIGALVVGLALMLYGAAWHSSIPGNL
jgi:Kef-type K+ transport system membrane component KefB